MRKLITISFILLFGMCEFSYAYDRYRSNDNFSVSISVGSRPTYYQPNSRCQYIPAHWYRGNWYPGRVVCSQQNYRYTRCELVPGHWQRGMWYPAHQVCWRY